MIPNFVASSPNSTDLTTLAPFKFTLPSLNHFEEYIYTTNVVVSSLPIHGRISTIMIIYISYYELTSFPPNPNNPPLTLRSAGTSPPNVTIPPELNNWSAVTGSSMK